MLDDEYSDRIKAHFQIPARWSKADEVAFRAFRNLCRLILNEHEIRRNGWPPCRLDAAGRLRWQEARWQTHIRHEEIHTDDHPYYRHRSPNQGHASLQSHRRRKLRMLLSFQDNRRPAIQHWRSLSQAGSGSIPPNADERTNLRISNRLR